MEVEIKNKKKAMILTIIAVLVLVALVIGGTYAYFQAQAGDNSSANINVATNTTDLLQFKIDKDISIHANQANFSQGKGSISDSATASALLRANNKTNSATARYNIYYVIETNDFIYTAKDNTAELLLNVTDPTGKKVENITGLINTGSGFDITTRTGGFLIVADYDIASNSSTQATKQDWKVEVTLVNLDSDQTANAGKSLSGKIYVTKEQLSSYELAQISKMTTTTTYDSISATAEVTPGTAEVKKYYFASEEVITPSASVDNGVRRLANTNNKLTYVESTTPNYKFTNLKENSTYKIYSYVEDANGIKSNVYETEIKTDAYVIPKVDSVSHTSTLNSISLTVSASKGSNDIVSYHYSNDNGLTYEESPNNTYTFNNLNDTTEYKIKVKVKDSAGRYSTEYYEAIETTTYILPVVTNVKSTTTYNSVTLTVTGTNGTNTIARYKYSINNGPYQESTNATYTFNGLNEKTNYPIKVIAVDTLGRESVVYITSVTTDAYKLPIVSNVILSSTVNSITLNVSGANGDGTITEYYYSKDGGSSYISTNSATHTFSGLTDSTTFYIKVKVKDNLGRYSTEYSGSIATKAYILPAVTNVSATTTYNSITLNVSGANGTNRIAKYRYSINNGQYQESASTTCTFNGLNENTNYPIKVVAVDTNNRESIVYTTNAITKAYRLPTVSNVTLSSTASSITINVSGTNGDGIIREYYYSKDGGSTYIKTSSATHTFNGLIGNTPFSIKVYVKDSNGKQSSVWSGNIATKSSLLTDHIKSKYTSQGANGLYLHNSSLANGANDGSYRYAGANPNNFVCFGSTAKPCPVDNLYRIIGVFGDKVKVIKSNYAATLHLGANGDYSNSMNYYYWNDSSRYNNWNESELNKRNLNMNYINILGTIWTNKIATTTWKVGGNKEEYIVGKVPFAAYINEIVSPAVGTTYNAKIGLMYASDYGFAADPSAWNTILYNYYTNGIPSKNWMYMGLDEWTITRWSKSSEHVIYVDGTGFVSNCVVNTRRAVRPVFYLTSSVTYVSGSGTQNDPIIIN